MKPTAFSWLFKRLDWGMLAVTLLLLAIGILFVFSADARAGNPALGTLYRKQLVWIAAGLLCYAGAALTDYHRWIRSGWWLYGLGLLLLGLVFVPHVGLKVFGANRWIQVAGLGVFQPAELMKLATLLVLVRVFGWPGEPVPRWGGVVLALALVAVPLAFIVKQPDLGTALVFLPMLAAVMFVAGVPGRILTTLAGTGLLAVLLALAAIILPERLGWDPARQDRVVRMIGIQPYQRDRVRVFLDGNWDPLDSGWTRAQSQIAIGSGRVWGKGYLQGTQNILGFLPRTVTPNDFIFSVIAEEKGFAGCLVVLLLYALLLRGILRAAAAADAMGRQCCAGVAALVFSHAFINMAMTLGVLPVTGIPLPLISYGGTFMVGTLTALGLVQSVHIRGDWR